MQLNHKRLLAVLVLLAALGILAVTLVHALWYAPDQEVRVPEAAPATASAAVAAQAQDYPARLSIPSLHVDALVQHVGVTTKGTMGVPNNFTDVAWYKLGTVPGFPGSAVIDGHVDNGLSLAGVFKHLDQVVAGDDIFVTAENGQVRHFIVTQTAVYPYESVPTDQLFNRADGTYLNLITCTGGWLASGKTYDHRLVVYAVAAP